MKLYASFWKRLWAVCIDNLLSFAFFLIPFLFYQLNDKSLTLGTAALSLVFIIAWPVFTFYNTVYLVGARGSSIGKKIAGITVLDKRAPQLLGLRRAFLRQISKKLSWIPLGIGYLWMLLDNSNQTGHDKIAGSKASLSGSFQAQPVQNKIFRQGYLNLIAAVSIVLMFTSLFFLFYVSINIAPKYAKAFHFANIHLSAFTLLALNLSALIKKLRLFIILVSPFSLLIFLIPKDKKLSILIAVMLGLEFLAMTSGILFALHHPRL